MSGSEHEKYVLSHSEALKRHEEDINRLYLLVEGIPQRIENLEQRVSELVSALSEFMRRQEDKYQTKEVCGRCEASLLDKYKGIEKAIEASEKKHEKLVWAGVSAAGFVAWEVIKYLPKVFGL